MPGTIRPASEVLLRHGDYTVTLRASLRAAVALENTPEGFAGLFDQIAGQSLSATYTVIRAAAKDMAEAERLLAHVGTEPLAAFLRSAQADCLALMWACLLPAQGEASNPEPAAGPEITLSQFFTELFSRATSWLHWPPSEVWNASVSEIVTALEAQADRELRRAGVEPTDTAAKDAQRKANIAAGLDPEFDREKLRALRSKLRG
ncbi:hypothetical protein [Szabonella alba]|uniref:Phage tail assembly chaperone protein, TAC n=1 Tax=Szabonella alba TaxID=2804194 RepID=A0A8K0VDS7_9RHOB|nr:hypothetical protein [Szabonella alba]MBL4917457.1 hypothetical protein [Szabonella alba]